LDSIQVYQPEFPIEIIDNQTINDFCTDLNLNEPFNYGTQLDPLIQRNTSTPVADYTFNSQSGSITINSCNCLPTNSLNSDNLFNLLKKLEQNNQLQLSNDSLTSEFFMTPEELDSLLGPNPTLFDDPLPPQIFPTEIPIEPNEPIKYQCQELCCLLKFHALE